jgi:hypothetical protein
MTTTYPIIKFGRNDMVISDDIATISCTNLQSFADINDLETGVVTYRPYITYEPNFWLLDGGYKFKPSTPVHVGLMSSALSGADRNFAVGDRPVLTITFNSVHSTTNGLKVYFSEYTTDYVDSILFDYYDASNVLIRSDLYNPSGTTFSTGQAVNNFKKVVITCGRTNKAYRYARITQIDFDSVVQFKDTDVKSARVVEQINPLSVELPFNTLDFTLFSNDGDFSIVDPSGFYSDLQNKEPIDLYESIDNETLYMGRFYLDTWESQTENLATFRSSDAIGLLDGITATGGYWSSHYGSPFDIAVEDLLSLMFASTDIDYELDASLNGTVIEGVLPVCTYREALQQIAFACGAYVTCARSNVIQIKPTELASSLVTYDHTITSAQKALGQPVSFRPLVTGVEVISHLYNEKNRNIDTGSSVEFLVRSFPAGDHTIIFDELQHNLYLTGATLVSPAVGMYPVVFLWGLSDTFLNGYTNYLVIHVASPTTVHIESEATLLDQGKTVGVYMSVPTGTKQNILSITDATLVHADNVQAITQQVYDYYQQRYLQKAKLFGSKVAVGDSVLIDTQSGRQIKGIVEKMETDLAGGMISNTEIIGVVV